MIGARAWPAGRCRYSPAIGSDDLMDPSAVALMMSQPSAALTLLPVPTSVQLGVSVLNSDGSTRDVTGQVTWSTSNGALATVVGGLVLAVAVGSPSVTATLGGLSISVPIAVSLS